MMNELGPSTSPARGESLPRALEDDCEVQRVKDIVGDIAATVNGTSKAWMNVQFPVRTAAERSAKLLLMQQAQIRSLTEEARALRQAVAILLDDRQTKEERYVLDREASEAAVADLKSDVREIQDVVRAQQQTIAALLGMRESGGGSNNSRDNTLLVQDLAASVADLQQSVGHLHAQHQQQQQQQRLRHQSNGNVYNDGSANRGSLEDRRRDARAYQRLSEADDEEEDNNAMLQETIISEVRQLNQQWKQFLYEQQQQQQHHAQSPRRSVTSPQQQRRRVSSAAVEIPPQKARWFWAGDGNSHFSRAVRRGPPHGASPPLPFDDQRLCDPRTQCWYTVGSCPFDVPGNGGASPASDYDGGVCFLWARPSLICIERTGIYRYTTGLVHAASDTSASAVLLLYVNGQSVGHVASSSSYVIAHNSNTTTNSNRLSLSPARRRRASSPSTAMANPSPPPSLRYSSASRRRPCCDALQCATNTVSDYVFLTAGAVLTLRSHNASNTKAVYEAFFELEYVA